MNRWKKQIIIGAWILFILLTFRGVFADTTGTCGTNVKYTVSGDTISFSKTDSGSDAVWGENCKYPFSNEKNIKIVKITDTIRAINSSRYHVPIGGMFSGCSYVQKMYLSKLDVSNVTNMFEMFSGCSSLTVLDISGWNTSNVTDMAGMFYGCSALTALDVSKLNTAKVTDMYRMFFGCSKLTALDVSGFNTAKVTDISGMFSGCSSLTALDLSNWNTANVTEMWDMFRGCNSITALDVSNLNTVNVTNMQWMFAYCSSLTYLDLSKWNTANVEYIDYMFYDCNALHSLILGKNSLRKNIFHASDNDELPAYTSKWYYVIQGNDASQPLDLMSERDGPSLFGSYKYDKMAGTWSTDLLAYSVMIRDTSGKNITGKTVTIYTAGYQLKAVAEPSWASQSFTWSSNDSDVATVNTSGKITFKKAGTVIITAKVTDGSGKLARVKLIYAGPTAVKIKNSSGTDITGKTVTVNAISYQLKAAASPAGALQKFTWKSSNTGIAAVDSNGKVTFKKAGTVTITVTASDGSKKSAWVKLKCPVTPVTLEIKDSNVRGKNKEIQVVIPWSSGLTKVECKLYDDETNKAVSPLPAYRERMDANGRNRIISWVGSPLENGHVYRMEIRVYNGLWSNKVTKYGMPIANVYGATVVAGNKTMVINTKHREPADGTRYMIYDPDTGKEIAYKAGTRTNTTWTYSDLMNGKLYYVVAVSYRDYKGQRLWGPNENKIWFVPMNAPAIPTGKSGVVSSGSDVTVTITNDTNADGIRVLYRKTNGSLGNGCEAKGNKCTIKNLNIGTVSEFYIMKYKEVNSKKYYSMGLLLRGGNDDDSGLKRPQMNPTVAMNNSGYTTFTIKKAADAAGISVLYRVGEGAFKQACEAAGNSCSTTLDVTKSYTFYIMQYKTVNGKKVYSPGIVARDFSSNKTGTGSSSAADIGEEPAAKGLEELPAVETVYDHSLDLYRLEEDMRQLPVPGFSK